MNYLNNKKILITGASSGIGSRIIYGIDKGNYTNIDIKTGHDLSTQKTIDYIVDIVMAGDIDTIFLNAGIGDFNAIGKMDDKKLDLVFSINTLSNIKIINGIWEKIANDKMKIVVTLSTAAYINGAYESVYNASKKAMKEFIISANTELIDQGSKNQIFMFVPHFIGGTKMTGGEMNVEEVDYMIQGLFESLGNGSDIYMPKYDEVYKRVFDHYKEDPYAQGMSSIEYKKNKGKI